MNLSEHLQKIITVHGHKLRRGQWAVWDETGTLCGGCLFTFLAQDIRPKSNLRVETKHWKTTDKIEDACRSKYPVLSVYVPHKGGMVPLMQRVICLFDDGMPLNDILQEVKEIEDAAA